MAPYLFALAGLSLGLSFMPWDRYALLFQPTSILMGILLRMHTIYLSVPLYKKSIKKLEEAYRLLNINRQPYVIPSAMWSGGLLLVLLSIFAREPILFLPSIFLFFYLPTYANTVYAKYKKGLSSGLMEFVDLTAVGVTAGLPLTSALSHVAEGAQTIFFEEMKKVMLRLESGSSLREELMRLTKYNDSPEFASFIEQISSLYETGGMNASEILIGIGSHLREMYNLRMEKELEKIQMKMLIPLFLSMIGALILIGGPVVMYVGQFMGGMMNGGLTNL